MASTVFRSVEGHLLGDQLGSTGLHLLALGWAQLPDNVIHVRGHGYSFPFSDGPGEHSGGALDTAPVLREFLQRSLCSALRS
jgi:hypothetical protein